MTAREIAKRLRTLAKVARDAGFLLIADGSDVGAIRVVSREEEREENVDLRNAGISVEIHGACGFGIPPRKDGSGNG